jgi:antitoxin (DNA-binding transcriptional repressor) of toxin-antitoxin stability system
MYVLSEVRVKTVSPTELRSNIYKLLDEVLSSGVPLEINKGGEILRIVPVATTNKLSNWFPGRMSLLVTLMIL